MISEEQRQKNSHKITIFRASSFLGSVQTGLDEYYAMSNKNIGSYWDSKSSMKAGSGLDYREIEVLLPLVIDTEPTDKDFKAKVKAFYDDIVTKVAYKEGVILEIGLEDNSIALSKENLPLVPMDYIRYRHAQHHPWVAENREESEGNQLKTFYIYDPETMRISTVNQREQKDKAMEQYLILTKEKDMEHMDDILAVLGEDPRGFKSRDEKLDHLLGLINSPNKEAVKNLFAVMTDKKIAVKGLLEKLVHTGVLRKIGSRYLIAETDKIFADGIEEALLELGDTDKNSQLITVFKSQLQEKMKAKVQRQLNRRVL